MNLQNYIDIKEYVDSARARYGRDILLLVVSKGKSAEDMLELANKCFVSSFAESRLQEALAKIEYLNRLLDKPLDFHFIGNLQKNKLKKIVEHFSLIHSFDNEGYLEIVDRYAKEFGKEQKILLQVNIAGEKQKGGVSVEELPRLYEKAKQFSNIIVSGLMFMPPYTLDNDKNRPYFEKAYELFSNLHRQDEAFKELSMGMSHDYKVTIEYGASILRVGTAIFE